MDIRYESVNTTNENGDRFVLTIDEDNSVTIYDNHKRDGYGLYCGDECKGFMGENGKVSKTNFKYFVDKLNELYDENQSLKNGSEYHKRVMDKIDKCINEYEFLFMTALNRYHKTKETDDFSVYKAYEWVLNDLVCIRDYLQGEEYE